VRAPLQARTVHPSHGPQAGGTLITIEVAQDGQEQPFRVSDEIRCDIGGFRVPARRLQANSISCTVSRSENVQISVVRNGVIQSLGEHGLYTFEQEASVMSLSPKYGPETGDIWISVFGSGFVDSEELVCMFFRDSLSSLVENNVRFVSEAQVKCRLPSKHGHKKYLVTSE